MQFADFRDRPLVFIDLEMTGLDPTIHEIIEIGALVVNPKTFEIEREYEAKIIPGHIETADPVALRINGYKPENWKTAIPLKTAMEDLNALAPGAMIVGWNMALDWIFLTLACKQTDVKRTYDYHAIDILPIAWANAPAQVKDVKLSEFCDHFKIKRDAKHEAMADIKATYDLFRKLMSQSSLSKF